MLLLWKKILILWIVVVVLRPPLRRRKLHSSPEYVDGMVFFSNERIIGMMIIGLFHPKRLVLLGSKIKSVGLQFSPLLPPFFTARLILLICEFGGLFSFAHNNISINISSTPSPVFALKKKGLFSKREFLQAFYFTLLQRIKLLPK